MNVNAYSGAGRSFLSQTFGYLGASLALSAVCAVISIALHIGPLAALGLSLGSLVALIAMNFGRRSGMAAPLFFIFSALSGLSLGPTLTYHLALPNGPTVVASALGATAVAFFGLMAYTSQTKRDFSHLGGFLFTGLIIVLVLSLVGIFVPGYAFQMMLAGVTAILFTGYLLFDLWRIQQRSAGLDPIFAAVSLYVDILNLFLSLLRIFGGSRN
jgi:modulator of FtsH protease